MADPAKVLRDLRDPDAAVGLAASGLLEEEARTKRGLELPGSRTATTALIAALGDPEPAVARKAIIAIAEITRRYFQDDVAYPGVVCWQAGGGRGG